MKKGFVIVTFILAIWMCGITPAHADSYNINSWEWNLIQMSHTYYYTWGINWTLPEGERIVGASITYNNIYNGAVEEDQLYTHLLNTVIDPNGTGLAPDWQNMPGYYQSLLISGEDNQGVGDQFAGQGLFLGVWDDPVGGIARGFNLSYDIPSAYFSWLSDGNFGFGIDPDCHYYTEWPNGLTVHIDTVPEPAILLLLGIGFVGIAGLGRRKFKK